MATIRKASPADVSRLVVELQLRGFVLYEHPLVGGVNPALHIRGSKHLKPYRAVDINRGPARVSDLERCAMDALAPELDARMFGIIWNRGPSDHHDHGHAETREADSQQYPGRYKIDGRTPFPTASGISAGRGQLTVDGKLGPATIARLQLWAGTKATGRISKRGSTFVRALQAYLNTEQRGRLTLDGTLGNGTSSAMARYVGVKPPKSGRALTVATVKELQDRLNVRGRITTC